MRWSVGIDPGFGEAGIVLRPDEMEDAATAWATYTCPPATSTDLLRATATAETMMNTLAEWITKYEVAELDVAIETPVYTRNPLVFTKQIRLFEELESCLLFYITGLVDELWLTEVNPTTSKILLTDNHKADKDQMIAASPWRHAVALTYSNQHTLADAYAHSLACWKGGGTRTHLTIAKAAAVKELVVWPR